MCYDLDQALNKWAPLATPVADHCDPEHFAASDIRRRTIAACFLQQPDWSAYRQGTTLEDLVLVDAVGPAREAAAQ